MSKKLSPHGKSGQARKTNAWGDKTAGGGAIMSFGKKQFLPAKSGPLPSGPAICRQRYIMASSECASVEGLKILLPQ